MASNTNKQTQLPISRVRTIMKSSPLVENISNECIHLVAKATELFIQYLAQQSLTTNKTKRSLEYRDIAEIVNGDHKLEFLRELIPHKITVKQYKDLMNRNKKSGNTSENSDSEESEE